MLNQSHLAEIKNDLYWTLIIRVSNACFVSYTIIEVGLVKKLSDQDDRANKFCPII